MKSLLDAHYTPEWLADLVVSQVRMKRPRSVADLAAGRGGLLLQASQQWPSAAITAVDIDLSSVRYLGKTYPGWTTGRCDLLNPNSTRHSPALRSRFSVLLLNPPFSCRGGTTLVFRDGAEEVPASISMSFTLHALKYLAPRGEAIVLLPSGALHSNKDARAWHYLRRRYSVEICGEWTGKQTFPGCAASFAMVRFKGAPSKSLLAREAIPRRTERRPPLRARVTRGNCPLRAIRRGGPGPALVHTTELKGSRVLINGHRGVGEYRRVAGPAVLIPRVGQLTTAKVALYQSSEEVMLSDCVIALKTANRNDTTALHARLLNNIDVLSAQYVGTGAPFITLSRLATALREVSIETHD